MARFLRVMSQYLQYFYYMRFSFLLWLFLPAVASTDHAQRHSALLHAIFTPEYAGQFIGCAFFCICMGWVALLMARVVCLNGGERFLTPTLGVPRVLAYLLGTQTENTVLTMLFASQLPNLYLFYRLHENAKADNVSFASGGKDILAMIFGFVFAFIFWYLATAIFYWSYPFSAIGRSARTLLLPRWLFRLGPVMPPPDPTRDSMECGGLAHAGLSRPMEWFFSRIASIGPGYRLQRGDPLWEGHRLLIIGLLGYFGVYIFLFPITAPVEQVIGNRVALMGATAFFAFLAVGIGAVPVAPGLPKTRRSQITLAAILTLLAALSLFWFVRTFFKVTGSIPGVSDLWFRPPLQFFPVLGSVAVLVTFVSFILAGAAFFLDRYSFPVLTSVLIIVILQNQLFARGGEHYYRAEQISPSDLLTPSAVLLQRCPDPSKICSLIVVTSTGGGMHASVWSSTVLGELEKRTHDTVAAHPKIESFHSKLLFASTVSGGSFGLISFLREYRVQSGTPFDPSRESDIDQLNNQPSAHPAHTQPNYQIRMSRATSCSALEAVAWGLEYSDFIHMLFPFVRPTSNYDRSNALEVASARNFSDPKCGNLPVDETRLPAADDINTFSLAALKPSIDFPAFALNATEVETGGRFLLANYRNPDHSETGVYPAESFLQAYPANIRLVTAARLSATYPFVSSAARIDPSVFGSLAGHFVDGGYYDNDGTASLDEFLASAFESYLAKNEYGGVDKITSLNRPRGRVRILVIEIRDGSDLDVSKSPEAKCTEQEGCKSWGALEQSVAPLRAFWNTGHVSITRRNRRELTLLADALRPQAELTEVVFPFAETPPLSWHLTPSEQDEIRSEVGKADFGTAWAKVFSWMQQADSQTTPPKTRHHHRHVRVSRMVCGCKSSSSF